MLTNSTVLGETGRAQGANCVLIRKEMDVYPWADEWGILECYLQDFSKNASRILPYHKRA